MALGYKYKIAIGNDTYSTFINDEDSFMFNLAHSKQKDTTQIEWSIIDDTHISLKLSNLSPRAQYLFNNGWLYFKVMIDIRAKKPLRILTTDQGYRHKGKANRIYKPTGRQNAFSLESTSSYIQITNLNTTTYTLPGSLNNPVTSTRGVVRALNKEREEHKEGKMTFNLQYNIALMAYRSRASENARSFCESDVKDYIVIV